MKEKARNLLRNNDLVEGAIFLVVAVLGIIFSIISHQKMDMEWKLSPYLFPLVISLILFALSISLLLESRNRRYAAKRDDDTHWRAIFLYVAICLVYYLVISYIGFIVSTVIFLVVVFRLLGVRKWWLIALLASVATLAIYILFAMLLHVMLPQGSIYYYLGL
ncbi:MAG: tripartite tricarboxylate transporter TctB family protein [Spirochaetales bacterium]|nr:tripartite tricarboxylate transporter TctB family protein [Spirochaetales bacterium]